MASQKLPSIIFFDVIGTVVEWRHSIANELNAATQKALQDESRHLSADLRIRASDMSRRIWHDITAEWHSSYMNFGNTHDASKPFVSVDEHNRGSLEEILSKWLILDLFDDDELQHLTLAWHRLAAHQDSIASLSCLGTTFPTSTLSNGNIQLLEDLKKHNFLPFTHITSAEHLGAYKPSPEAYHGAARRFGVETSQCCLVAAHLGDLQAAKKCGFHTIYIERELEEAWDAKEVARAREAGFIDYWVEVDSRGLVEVANYLGCE